MPNGCIATHACVVPGPHRLGVLTYLLTGSIGLAALAFVAVSCLS